MKIGPSTIGAVVFTAVSVAAFGWMTQRPEVSGQAIGLAMPSSGSASSAVSSASTDASKATADSSNAATTENVSDEKTTETTEKAEETPATNDDAGASATEAQTSESSASTENAAEEEKSAETTASSMNAESQASSNTTSTMTQAAGAVTAGIAQNGVESTEADTSSESSTPATAPEQASAEAQTEQPSSSEPAAPSSETTATSTTPAIQAVQLKSTNGTSAGIYTAATNARGTVVILHGCDYKPEGEDDVVRPLHEGLPQEGWNTLSLQLPNLSASSSYKDLEAIMPDAAARIESGVTMAKEKSQTPVVLFAHGCGAQVALAWMEVKGSDSINGYIGLGAGVMNASADDASHLRLPLEKMKFPQLDIYGTADNEAVLKTAPERLSHINRAANPASRQKKIEGADHNITGKGKELSAVVVKWLNGLAFKK